MEEWGGWQRTLLANAVVVLITDRGTHFLNIQSTVDLPGSVRASPCCIYTHTRTQYWELMRVCVCVCVSAERNYICWVCNVDAAGDVNQTFIDCSAAIRPYQMYVAFIVSVNDACLLGKIFSYALRDKKKHFQVCIVIIMHLFQIKSTLFGQQGTLNVEQDQTTHL